MCAHCLFTFIDVEYRSWVCFSYYMNNGIQTDLPLKMKMIHVSLIHVTNGIRLTNYYSVFCIDFLKKKW